MPRSHAVVRGDIYTRACKCTCTYVCVYVSVRVCVYACAYVGVCGCVTGDHATCSCCSSWRYASWYDWVGVEGGEIEIKGGVLCVRERLTESARDRNRESERGRMGGRGGVGVALHGR